MLSNEELSQINGQLSPDEKRREIYLSMKERLNDIIQLMNMMGFDEELSLSVSKKVEQEKNLKTSASTQDTSEETIDMTKIYVGTCSDGSVGLFNRRIFSANSDTIYNKSGAIYIGIDSEKVGIVFNNYQGYCLLSRESANIGTYIHGNYANVKLTSIKSFEDIRKYLHIKGLLPDFKYGEVSATDVEAVLEFVKSISKEDDNSLEDHFKI